MNLKAGLVSVFIIASFFSACNRGGGAGASSAVVTIPADPASIGEGNFTANSHTALSYETESFPKILDGDLSEFSGVWINGHGQRRQLMPNGVFALHVDAIQAYGFERTGTASGGSYYKWVNEGDSYGYIVELFPVGVDVTNGDMIVQTDTTKARMFIYAYDLYYTGESMYYFESPELLFAFSDPRELHIGSFDSGNINPGQAMWYSVTATETGILTIEAYSNIDTILYAYDVQRNYITANDDWDDQNPRIELVVEANVTYLFRLSGYIESTGGTFRIMVSGRPLPVATELETGTFLDRYMEQGEEHWYSVTITGSDFDYLIIETSGRVNIGLSAYTVSYQPVQYYDYSSFININIFGVEAGTTYLIKLTSDNSGSYRILASEVYSL